MYLSAGNLYGDGMSGCEQYQFSAGISESCEKIVHGSRTSPRTDRDALKLGDLAVRPEGLEGRTAIFSQLPFVKGGRCKDRNAGEKLLKSATRKERRFSFPLFEKEGTGRF